MEFDLRAGKLAKEAEKRRIDAKNKRDRERRLEEEQTQRELALAEVALQRKAEEEEAELLRQENLAKQLLKTGGISFSISALVPYLVEGEDDRVILPESALVSLHQLDVFRQGVPLFFEISDSSTAAPLTHCGVKEFSAPEGSVGVPLRIANSLRLKSDLPLENTLLAFQYVILPKLTSVTFRPRSALFFGVGPIKQCLQDNLTHHATLSVRDIVTVWYRGKSFDLEVVAAAPAECGSLVDTDLVVEFEEMAATETAVATTSTAGPPPIAAAANAANVAASNTSALLPVVGVQSTNYSALLPPEPADDADSVVHIRFRTDRGSSFSRRFLQDTTIRAVLEFVAFQLQLNPVVLELSVRQLHQVFTVATILESQTLESIGFGKREVVQVSVTV